MTELRSIESVIAEHGGVEGVYVAANACWRQAQLIEEGYDPPDEIRMQAIGGMIQALQRLQRDYLKAGHPEHGVVIHQMVGTLLPQFRAGLERWKAENPE